MATRELTEEQMQDILDDAIEVRSRPWRHGRTVYLVFEVDGAHWGAWFNMHHEEGDQTFYPVTATQVHQVERVVKVWEPVP